MRGTFHQFLLRGVPLTACSAAMLAVVLAGPAAAARHAPQRQAGLTVVHYGSVASLRSAALESGARVVRRISQLHLAELRTAPAAARALQELKGIGYLDAPVLRHALAEPAIAPAPVFGGAYEWQYAATRAELVPQAALQAASGVKIAVLDSGADVLAPDLAAKAPATWSVTGNSTDVTDYQGHGTFVASLAAGSRTNAEGVAGFGGDSKLLVVQTGASSFTDVDEAAAIVYAVDHGARVINMSFGGPTTSATEKAAIDYAVSHGVLLVAAAGNSGLSGNPPMYPAALLQPLGSNGQGGIGLSVGATSINGSRASFSSYGSYISLAAPGENVFGALSSGSDPSEWPRHTLPGSAAGLYGYANGTSFSSPEVAGAAAVVWGANPLLNAAGVAAILKQTASGNGSWNQETGYGVLDVAAAVARAQGVAVTPPVAQLSGNRSGLHLTLSWSATNALSYRLTVSRDGGPTQVLLGATTSTSAAYELEPGHTYSFTVSATDAYGATAVSAPYVLTLPFSAVKLGLRVARGFKAANGRVRLSAIFNPESPTVARAGRTVVLESFDGRTWHSFARARTNATGVASWTMKLRRGRYRIRAHYAGALDLGAATSGAVKLRVG
jgi:subtilisin family serine protease